MQYSPATLMMPHPMMPPPPPPPAFFGYLQPMFPPPHQGKGSVDENKTIWVGDLHYWMDESFLHSCFGHTGEVWISALFLLNLILVYGIDFMVSGDWA